MSVYRQEIALGVSEDLADAVINKEKSVFLFVPAY